MAGPPDGRSQRGKAEPLRRQPFPTGLVFLVLIVCSPVPAFTQPFVPLPSTPTQPFAPTAPPSPELDIGPFRLRTSLTVQGEYNDNFSRSKEDKQEEFRESVTPGFSLGLSRGRGSADLSYAPSFIHSSVAEGEIQVFHLLSANASLPLSERLTLNASDRFRQTDEPEFTDPRDLRTGRGTLTQNIFNSDLTYQGDTWSLSIPRYSLTLNRRGRSALTRDTFDRTQGATREQSTVQTIGTSATVDVLSRNTLSGGYDLTIGEFTARNDFIGHTGRLGISRQLNPRTAASLGGSIAHRDVQDGTDFNIYSVGIGLQRDVTPLYTVDARFGYNFLDAESGATAQGLTFLLQGMYTGKSVRVSAITRQSLQETFLEAENVGVTETRETILQVSYDASSRLTLTLRGRLAEHTFLQSSDSTAVGQGQDREDVRFETGLDVAFQLTRLLSLTLGYTYTSLDSNRTDFGYQNNRVRVGLTVTYP